MPALWKLTLLPHVIGRVRLGGGIKGLPNWTFAKRRCAREY